MAAQLTQAFKQAFSEDSLRRTIEVNVFPQKHLAAGDTWKHALDQQSPMMGTLKLGFDCAYRGVETQRGESCAKIDLALEVKQDKTSSAAIGPMHMDFTIDQSHGKGAMYFAVASGRLISYELDGTLSGHMTLEKPEGSPGEDQSMNVDGESHQRILLLGAKDPPFESSPAKPASAKK
jgi:hypothetical protein